MAASWGKRALTRIDRSQFENDELLQSLGNQLNVDFSSYDQWKRKDRVMRPMPKKKTEPQSLFKVGLLQRSTSADSAPGPVPRGRRAQAKQEEERKRKQEILNVLELKIHKSRQATEMYRRRAKELIDINIALARGIEDQEKETHLQVKRLLRKYEKFRGGIATLNSNFTKELSEAQIELDRSKSSIEEKLEDLQKQIHEMDKKLRARQGELNVLHSYKDKEYPVKAMMIANLHTELESVKNSNQEDQEELENIMGTELGKYEKERVRVANDITKKVTEEAVSLMHPSLKDMALQNVVMKKEVEFHLKQQEALTKVNQGLEAEVKELLRHPKTNVRLQMFPEFFPQRGKCTPDMDVVLDIPTKKLLPI